MKLPGLIQFRLCTLTDQELAIAVAEALNKMYEPTASVPTRSIPARPNEDFDLLVGEMVVRFLERKDLFIQIRQIDINHKMEHGSFFLPHAIREKIAGILSSPE